MGKKAKTFIRWWLMAYMGFVVVRLSMGLPLGAKELIGGLIIQLVLVAVCWAALALYKRFRSRKHCVR